MITLEQTKGSNSNQKPDCPDENHLVAFLEHSLRPEEAEAVENHLSRCNSCRRLFAGFALTFGSASPDIGSMLSTRHEAEKQGSATGVPTLGRGEIVGRFSILERIGVGSMGAVYSAYDAKLDRKVSLKFLRADLLAGSDPDSIAKWQERLNREAQAMARLSHPNVVGIHDVGIHDQQMFIAMEHVSGVNLREWLQQEKRDWREILAVFLQAGRGLAAAHEAGLVHRDFKPDNVIVDRQSNSLVTDFGLARTLLNHEGQAEEQRLQRATLTDELLVKMWIEKWNGTVPEIFTGDEGNLLFQIPR